MLAGVKKGNGRNLFNKSVKMLPNAWHLPVSVGVTCALLIGCSGGNERPVDSLPGAPLLTWTEALTNCRSTILTGDWLKAESCWNRLLVKRPRSPEEISEWIQLQIDILAGTRKDRLKGGLRMSAVQQLYYLSDEARPHLTWLKQGLATNLFLEADVAQKAREVIAEMERNTQR
jgi:hypothetical protein